MTENKLIAQTSFDEKRCRHVAGSLTYVLHCHHFASLSTQLAIDCTMLDAKKLLADCSEDAFFPVLWAYYKQNNITGIKDRIEIAERYFAEAGLGKLKVKYAGLCAGEVELKHSHLDEGWIKKWGYSSKPINFIGCGYVTALFSTVFGRPRRSYEAKERQSIACGANVSIITVTDVYHLEKGGL